ncbi:gluconate:H+ symporter [Roseimicrobium sp. ORNL1]|uniref:GntT/GntP/DsdX family permease n=1 Tax=Roseimicrobium sp. ORNL1 TaxID=2711231 RepID=UPI0013E20907|nr:gluconate:H+ symporter [Roseimicrobium sp. ORNL1]QIF03311.1 permease DsdX [Roseimicrobium sp. ORNL1]
MTFAPLSSLIISAAAAAAPAAATAPASTASTSALLMLTGGAIILIVLLIAKLRMNAFLALFFAALLVGLGSGMEPSKVAAAFQTGMGKTLGGVAGILGLGTMLGGLLAASGGAAVLARGLIDLMGPKRVQWCLMLLALAVGFTTWFAVGLVMLVPILLNLTKETGMPFLKLALPLLAVLSIMHGVMPPHPGPLVAIAQLKANLGMVILWGMVAAIPMAALAGPIFASWAVSRVKVDAPEPPVASSALQHPTPTLGRTVAALALPVVLILAHTISELFIPAKPELRSETQNMVYNITAMIGNPTLALGLAVLFAGWAFKFTRADALKIGEKSLGPIGMTLLVVGAGGGLNQMLQDSGSANAIADMARSAHLPPMVFGWLCAALVRVATGSATVAITAACGLVAPMALSTPGVNLELLVVCVGCGSLFLSHLNDAGFWIVKDLLGLTVAQTFRTWTVTETLIGVSGLFVCWGLDMIF